MKKRTYTLIKTNKKSESKAQQPKKSTNNVPEKQNQVKKKKE